MPKRADCRLCGSRKLTLFLDLGKTPLAGHFPTKEELGNEKFYPLEVFFCENCTSVQVLESIPAEILFKDYRYLSSVSKTLAEHFTAYAKEVYNRFIPKGGFVVEFGCNDGVLLKPFKDLGATALGIEPAENVAKIARGRGLEIMNDFFSESLVEKIAKEYGKADVIAGNNVYAHIDDMDGVTKGIKKLLAKNGVFVFEVHYVASIILGLQYDMIYHEHMMYHSIHALKTFLEKHGLEIFDAKKVPIHGGSIRVFSCHRGEREIESRVKELLAFEHENDLDSINGYVKFASRVKEHKKNMVAKLRELKSSGKRIAGYGMSGRANTMLNYWGTGKDIIDFGIDASPERFGRFVPGLHIPIKPPGNLEGIDVVVLLAWTYKKEIMEKEWEFAKRGRFLVPFPEPHLEP
ncbi:MAG: class I SAM-dependent methyltransferase [Candidatus Aenigmarchaeota archaeon]|nr:class I SAM-dependent methyltransferase [Candidatus Aenigmarchaeota archaeon]